MTEKVTVALRSRHKENGQVSQDMVLCMPGEYRVRNGVHMLTFDEPAEDGGEETHCVVYFRQGVLTVKRSGPVRVCMQFEEGRTHPFDYETPYGVFSMTTKTLQLTAGFGKEQGTEASFAVRYLLSLEGNEGQDCEITIKAASM